MTMRGYESEARTLMGRANFSHDKVRESLIWAAKYRACPRCSAAIGKPCENLTDRRRDVLTFTRYPHNGRIDWQMLVEKLKARGYR